GAIDACDLGGQLERKTLLFQDALKLPGDLAVDPRHNTVKVLDDHDIGTQPVPHRAELEPDYAGADAQQSFRHLLQRQRTGRGLDALFVDRDALELRDIGAGGDHDVPGFHGLRLAVGGHLDLPGAENSADAGDDVDLVLLHQELDALDVAVDTLLLEIHHRGQVELRRRHADAHPGEGVGGFLEHFGGMQQRL